MEEINHISRSQETNRKIVSEINIFEAKCSETETTTDIAAEFISASVVHNGDTDSSDDEERRNYTERKYDDYGSNVKKSLDYMAEENLNKKIEIETRLHQSNFDSTKVERSSSFKKKPAVTEEDVKNTFCVPEKKTQCSDVYTDPVFGIRIIKPLMSSTALVDRMQGRKAIRMWQVKRHVENEDLLKDWVIAGVIVRISTTKKSQKGNQFVIWTLSDLRGDLKTVSIFLFRKAYTDLWKTPEGTVVAVLNPNVLDKSQSSNDQACLSVENPDRVVVLGQSKDLGVCKSKKNNGKPCTLFVNVKQCEYCIYHVKQEHKKYSRRQELQSSTMSKGLVNLQNKVLGKSTVINYGKSYSALPQTNNKMVKGRDQNSLMTLSDSYKSEGDNLMTNKAPLGAGPLNKVGDILHSPKLQRTSDCERLNKLITLNSSPQHINKAGPAEQIVNSPMLGGLKGSGKMDLNISYGQKAAVIAKSKAIKLVKQSGGIPKIDPNNTKGTEAGKKRALEKLNVSGTYENNCKKAKHNNKDENKSVGIKSQGFKKTLEVTTAHQNLIKQHDVKEQEKYFRKLEKKEAMEEKMLNTSKLPCKAVRCIKCKYTAFSAAQRCKDERHPLKYFDTHKRFFKCADCDNRTVSLHLMPVHSCSKCKGSRWKKAPMLREKNGMSQTGGLSIRGDEQTFLGGTVNAGKNINLLVPDS